MKTESNQLSLRQKVDLREITTDPVLFARQLLGTALWERQVEILRSIQKYTRTAVKACHAAGKTYALSLAILWWLARYEDGIALITSPTQRQVRDAALVRNSSRDRECENTLPGAENDGTEVARQQQFCARFLNRSG
jgi:hypothetical protein